MITSEALANYFETQLNDLVPTGAGYEFKIWAEAGEFKRYYKNGNDIIYYINGLLSVKGSALTPNMLVMGTNGVTVEFLVPVDTPKTGYDQTDEELARVQNGQFYFIQQVGEILQKYFTVAKKLSMTDSDGVVFNMTAYSGVSISGVIDIKTIIGVAMPMTVSITLNFGDELISGLDVLVYVDGEQLPYLTFTPSRAEQLATDLQSNAVAQKHLSTATAFGMQFTLPAALKKASKLVYDYIADKAAMNMAHFVEIIWGNDRDDVYFTIFTSANANVAGAEFAGLNASMGEAYQNEEFLALPETFGAGKFSTQSSLVTQLDFDLNIVLKKRYHKDAKIPLTLPIYYRIANKNFKLVGKFTIFQEDGDMINANFTANTSVSVQLSAENFIPDDDEYFIYILSNGSITSVKNITPGFTFSNI